MARLVPFQKIFNRAAERKGGVTELENLLSKPKKPATLKKIAEAQWLAMFSRGIFATGLNWRVVENKWEGIEDAYEGFDVGRMAMMSDEDLDRLLKDKRVIRQAAKILSVRDNAVFLQGLAREHGSAAACFADWPSEDFKSLIFLMKDRGARLGGATGAYALRRMGVDGYVLTKDVSAALVREGVVDKVTTSKKTMNAVQEAFNTWREESSRPLTQISQVLAMSVGET